MRKTCILTLLALAGLVTSRAQWVQQKSGTTASLTDVSVVDSTLAYAVGRDGSILKTTDGGRTWVNNLLIPLFFHPLNAVSFSGPESGCAVGDNGHIFTTTDGGKTWPLHAAPDGRKCISVLQVWPSDIYVGADSGWVFRSVDTGRTWSSERISTWPIRSIFAWRGFYAMGLPVYALTPYSLCSKVEFPPSSWRETMLPAFQGLGSEAFRGEFCDGGGAGFIVGVQGDFRAAPAIVRKPMSDTVWRTVSGGLQDDGTFYGVSAPSSDVIYVCGDHGMIYSSTNGGDTWEPAYVPSKYRLRAISFSDETHGFAVGDSGVILATSNGGMTGIREETGSGLPQFALLQNYPNPFNGISHLGYRIPEATLVTLKVYDALGREVAVLVDEKKEPGTYEVRLDGSHLASGVYFCRMHAGGFVASTKLLLIR